MACVDDCVPQAVGLDTRDTNYWSHLTSNQHTLHAQSYDISINKEFFKDASTKLQSVDDKLCIYLGFSPCAKGADILNFWEVHIFNQKSW